MKKSIIFISISLVLIILLGIGVSYSMWNISVSQDTTNMAESKCFDLSISNQENSINLDNAYPISNDKGKSLTPYAFTVTNTCDITAEYSVNLEVLNSSTLSSNFIDVMFEGNINLLSNYDSTDKVNTSSIESRKLTTGILKSGDSKDYSLRLWIDYNTTLEDLNNEIKYFKSKIIVVGKPINYTGDTVFNFDYTGGEQTFVAPVSGIYKLETWGAEGNSTGQWQTNPPASPPGKGGFSSGKISLNFNEKLFISVGNGGEEPNRTKPYNGGGRGSANGGGATSIQNAMIGDGQLKNYSNNLENIIIVSGGGGGTEWGSYGFPGNGGGVVGTSGHCDDDILSATGGTQTTGGKVGVTKFQNIYDISASPGEFGIGGNSYDTTYGTYQTGGAGGGGFYGGAGTAAGGVGAGGSGYIGNTLLTDKAMYCYNCEESFEESTKTISTTCNEETPTSYCAKKGNGYARITLVSIDE